MEAFYILIEVGGYMSAQVRQNAENMFKMGTLYPCVHSSTIYTSRDLETSYMSIAK